MTELGMIAYNAYCRSTGGVSAVTGAKLPDWNEQSPEIRTAWNVAADALQAHFNLALDNETGNNS
jgi:hypothetical protein